MRTGVASDKEALRALYDAYEEQVTGNVTRAETAANKIIMETVMDPKLQCAVRTLYDLHEDTRDALTDPEASDESIKARLTKRASRFMPQPDTDAEARQFGAEMRRLGELSSSMLELSGRAKLFDNASVVDEAPIALAQADAYAALSAALIEMAAIFNGNLELRKSAVLFGAAVDRIEAQLNKAILAMGEVLQTLQLELHTTAVWPKYFSPEAVLRFASSGKAADVDTDTEEVFDAAEDLVRSDAKAGFTAALLSSGARTKQNSGGSKSGQLVKRRPTGQQLQVAAKEQIQGVVAVVQALQAAQQQTNAANPVDRNRQLAIDSSRQDTRSQLANAAFDQAVNRGLVSKDTAAFVLENRNLISQSSVSELAVQGLKSGFDKKWWLKAGLSAGSGVIATLSAVYYDRIFTFTGLVSTTELFLQGAGTVQQPAKSSDIPILKRLFTVTRLQDGSRYSGIFSSFDEPWVKLWENTVTTAGQVYGAFVDSPSESSTTSDTQTNVLPVLVAVFSTLLLANLLYALLKKDKRSEEQKKKDAEQKRLRELEQYIIDVSGKNSPVRPYQAPAILGRPLPPQGLQPIVLDGLLELLGNTADRLGGTNDDDTEDDDGGAPDDNDYFDEVLAAIDKKDRGTSRGIRGRVSDEII